MRALTAITPELPTRRPAPDYGWVKHLKSGVEDQPSGCSTPQPNDDRDKPLDIVTGHILVVEDESIVALDIQRTLRRFGHTVVGPVDTGQEAILQARRQRPDVILMDIRLRGTLDGIDAAEIISRELQIPIIFMTAQADVATRERAEAVVPAAYLLKPFVNRELAAIISTVLGGNIH